MDDFSLSSALSELQVAAGPAAGPADSSSAADAECASPAAPTGGARAPAESPTLRAAKCAEVGAREMNTWTALNRRLQQSGLRMRT